MEEEITPHGGMLASYLLALMRSGDWKLALEVRERYVCASATTDATNTTTPFAHHGIAVGVGVGTGKLILIMSPSRQSELQLLRVDVVDVVDGVVRLVESAFQLEVETMCCKRRVNCH